MAVLKLPATSNLKKNCCSLVDARLAGEQDEMGIQAAEFASDRAC